MTATPLREENRNTYEYFGAPVYTYSLRQGIDDGFLAPYRVHRVVTTFDAAGWRPSQGELDRYGREIPDDEYQTADFERVVALRVRTEAIARHLTDYLKATDRFGKTLVFCVDQEHASEMRRALSNANADIVADDPEYVCRVTADEGDVGKSRLSDFQELETKTPAILTTSQLLTTGVDAPTTKNIVIARVVNSMVEFKQIIGRGTRVRDDYGKLFFTIHDYTGSATRLFADPAFDGDPVSIDEVEIDDAGAVVTATSVEMEQPAESNDQEAIEIQGPAGIISTDEEPAPPRKYYIDSGSIEIAAHLVYELDPDGRQLRVVKFTDYTADQVRTMFPSAAALREAWTTAEDRARVIRELESRGIDFDALAGSAGYPESDPFDLLCFLAFSSPLRSRRERADRVRREEPDFFERYAPVARAVLNDLLDKYAEHGTAQFKIPEILKVPPISERGNVLEISSAFGGPDALRRAISELQSLLYG
jgi:type I restriction enzyme R subunit